MFTCLVTFGFFVSVHSASLFLKPIDIPVKVIYDEAGYNTLQTVTFKDIVGSRNLNEKIQLSPADLTQLSHTEEIEYRSNLNSVRNLDAKVQLSQDELRVAEKHLPLGNGKDDIAEIVPYQNIADESVKPEQNENPAANAMPTEAGKPNETVFGILGETPAVQETPSTTLVAEPIPTTEENLPDPNVVLLIQIAQNIVASGLESIRENIDNLATNEDGIKNPPITGQQWNRLNQTIQIFFASLLDRGIIKENSENVLQDILRGVRSVTNNFLQSLEIQSTAYLKNANPQTTGASQNIINLITSGFQQITENIGNIPNQSTTKSTADVTTASARPLQEGINQVQQVFGGQSAPNTSHVLPIQSDSPATPGGPFEAFQNVANQVGQAINNLNPFTTAAPPGSQGDEATTPGNPLQSFQNAANQVGQAINNLNPFNRPSSAAPGSQGDDPTTLNPLQTFQNAANQVGQAINSLNPFNRPPTAAPGAQGDAPTTTNPFQTFQNAANQVGEAINSLNPFKPTVAPGSQSEEATPANGPFQAVQNVVNQVGQAVNNFINQGSAPDSQNEESSTSLPIQQAFQNVANQLGAAINNLNPFNSPTTPASNLQSDSATTQNKPLQGVQDVVNQVGQSISGLNPLNQASTEGSVNNPSQGVQDTINQIGQAVSSLNPLNQGSSTPSSPVSGSLQTIQAIGNQGQQLLAGQTSVNPAAIQNAINKPADAISGPVEIIQSISSQITPQKNPVSEKKSQELLSEQEIMVAVD